MIVTGGAVSSGITTRVYDDAGNVLWTADHGDTVYAVAADADGNVYTGGAQSSGVTTRKYDSSGVVQWSVDHGGTVYGIAVDASGNVYTVGQSSFSDGKTTRKYDSSGAVQWGADNGTTARGAAVNGSTLITGGYYLSFSPTIRSYALDGTAGTTKYWGADLYAVALDSSGNWYMCGNGTAGSSRILRKANSAGTETWAINLGGGTGYGVAVDSSGNVYLGSDRVSSLTTRKYNSGGTLQWSADHGATVYAVAWAQPGVKTAIPGLPLALALGVPSGLGWTGIPGLPLLLSLGIPASPAPPPPPEWAAIPMARIYRAYLSAVGGSGLLEIPIASFQCTRRLGASTWLAITVPTYSAPLFAAIQAVVGGELVINAGTRDTAGIETLGVFLRATVTDVEQEHDAGAGSIRITARVINPSYSSASRALSDIRQVIRNNDKITVICDCDPLLKPNDTATARGESFVVGAIRYSVSPRDAFMEVVEDG